MMITIPAKHVANRQFESLDLTEKQLLTHVSRKHTLNSYGMDLVEKPVYYILAVHYDDVFQLCVWFFNTCTLGK